MDKFLLTRKRREYVQSGPTPKVSVDRETYIRLQEMAAETRLTISAVAKKAIEFAAERLEYVEE